jgi:hypothetical protein
MCLCDGRRGGGSTFLAIVIYSLVLCAFLVLCAPPHTVFTQKYLFRLSVLHVQTIMRSENRDYKIV